jgi:DNA-binding NarL/FixJ family response regulator
MTKVVAGPIVVATSVPQTRRRISDGLRRAFGVASIVDASDRPAFEKLVIEHQPPVVLLGPLRGFRALEALAVIRTLSPISRTIVMADAPAEAAAIDALKLGARGYCAPTTEPAVLGKAIELVLEGEIWIGRRVMLRLLDELTERVVGAARPALAAGPLTAREQQITVLIGDGASNKEIADRLTITEKTVKAHLTKVFRKLGVSSRLQLAVQGLSAAATKVVGTEAH